MTSAHPAIAIHRAYCEREALAGRSGYSLHTVAVHLLQADSRYMAGSYAGFTPSECDIICQWCDPSLND